MNLVCLVVSLVKRSLTHPTQKSFKLRPNNSCSNASMNSVGCMRPVIRMGMQGKSVTRSGRKLSNALVVIGTSLYLTDALKGNLHKFLPLSHVFTARMQSI